MLNVPAEIKGGTGRALADRLRVQLVAGLLIAVVLPAAVRANFMPYDLLNFSNYRSSVIASAIALVIGIYLFRRFRAFPGMRIYENVLPSFFVSYALVAAVLLAGRFDYATSVLFSSFVLSNMVFFFLCNIGQRKRAYVFHVVPSGDVDRLDHIDNVTWVRMLEPVLPARPGSGIVVDLRTDLAQEWQRMLADAALAGIPVYHRKQLTESMTGLLEIDHLAENSLGSLAPTAGYGKFKQVVDQLAAGIAIPLLLPLGIIIGAIIRLDSPGPALFRQQRMGFRGRPFTIYKFRTMRAAAASIEAGEACAVTDAITQDDDHRITSIGRWLRRTRIDELPQMINILRGEMSWIGPRPEAIPLSEWYDRELSFYSYRHVVRPGITGWAQVNQGHVAGIGDVHFKLCYDFYYIKYMSASLDGLIVWRTIRTVLTGFGSR